MTIFSKVVGESIVGGTLVGGSIFTGVAYEAAMHPEIGDTKDYSGTIGNSAEFGVGLALAYLGVKYGAKGLGMLRKPDIVVPSNVSAAQASMFGSGTGANIVRSGAPI